MPWPAPVLAFALSAPEDRTTDRMERPIGDKLVDRRRRRERGVELDERLRP